ncbi:MAG: permease [Burkholderiales bacterium]|nr:permease [Burkholderiales bacterium]
MNTWQTMGSFVVREGLLLAVLFFLVAFAIALMQQSLGQRLNNALGKTSLELGAVLAATAGAVTPFCSCSTVPVLAGMLRSQLRFGVCFTFLIASPVINEGVLLVLLRQQSSGQAALFLVTAFALSVAFGVALDRLGMARFLRPQPAPLAAGAVQVEGGPAPTIALRARARFAARSAWTELRSSAPYLAVGVAAGAVIYGHVPQEALLHLRAAVPAWALIVVMALVGVPFYVSPAMVVPIALALLDKGLGIGPMAAFLVSAAGTSVPELILLLRLFRVPLLVWHVVSIVGSATVIGLVLEFASRSL